MKKSVSYSDAGVSIDIANEAVKRIGDLAKSTFNERTLNDIGSFGGMFDAKFPDMSDPILVSSADGVGTKLKLAFEMNKHSTIGQDLVNHCVGDILAQGAKPLFFLDYFAAGKLSADVILQLSKVCRLRVKKMDVFSWAVKQRKCQDFTLKESMIWRDLLLELLISLRLLRARV